MAGKKTHALTATFVVEHSDGPKVSNYESLANLFATEWEGKEEYFTDGDNDEDTSVLLYVRSVETGIETT